MSIDKHFAQYLALYGTRPQDWPEEHRTHLLRAQTSQAGLALIAEAERFEALLREHAPVAEPSDDAQARIVRAAQLTPQIRRGSPWAQWGALLETVLPHPAVSFASVLVLGMLLGLGTPNLNPMIVQSHTATHHDLDDTGAIL